MSAPIARGRRTTSTMPKRLPKPCSARRCSSGRPRPRSNWICRRCIGCASGWCRNAPASSTRFAPSCWNAVRQGIGFLRTELPTILATRTDALSPRMLRVIEELAGDWRRLEQRIDGLSGEIEALARQDQACSRLMTVPGIGPIISSAMVAAIGTGDVFSKGRDFGAWLGLVPKQISTGDRTILGKISRRGNRYLRVLFVQAAWVVLVRIKNWERYGLKSWIEAAKKRLHHNVLAIALANKLARIAWAVLAKGRAFELTRTDDAGVRTA